ncbi:MULTISPECIES: CHAT domain-containing tetratricopeptide repeat protein [unclassified Tolypothrix]|uniref:CHAT domain-containing tetratricopeptide repeat protein n=1 Tax=unclassified Tolypothrix TaxID=2649714 RepID=UPI0005EAB72E|nr:MULTISPECIES: CHAT domain-containing protein [unclassified Tolypothrix]BAY95282.1 TPR domain protein [Microchaete diplosiphon NIES-3275]EKE98279.1 tetratricopeptide repeat protein [Tolypothrix sp. PCC 7601]MBE9084000.1 tetratricopeptide repeat protein [Tolypothrix sp. LEGE 11397]UYD30504.1 tetratricopeptide repeat protein [Tolypothrix sp. PCC 7712]UYD38362.1 tetratricopeptide repeat protein [Tolypothrix sp. PCC 7601]
MTKHKKLLGLASRAAALFFALLLLSESTAASLGSHGIKIAQQPASTPSVPLNAEQQKLYQQGVKLVEEAQELQKKGTKEGYEQAINKYQQALKIVQELRLLQDEFEILFVIGTAYNYISDRKNALIYFNKALEISRELKNNILLAKVFVAIGAVYTNTDEPEKALNYFLQAKSIFLQNQQLHELATTYKGLATVQHKLGNTKEALDLLNKALKIYRETLKDLSGEADTLYSIGFIYSIAGENITAINYYNQALKIQRQRRDLKKQAILISDIGALQGVLGNFEDALNSLKEALKLHQEAGSQLSDQASTLTDIGFLYASRGDYKTAIYYHQQARKLYQQAGNTYLESTIILVIANLHTTFSGDYQKALESLDEALTLQVNDKDGKASTFDAKADIYASQGDYQLALNEYNNALKISSSIPNPRMEARTLGKIALLQQSLGDYKSSIDTYRKVLEIYKRLPDKNGQIRTLLLISIVYQTQEKYDESLPFYNQALSLLSKDDYQSEISILHGMAKTHIYLKNYHKALDFANHALALSRQNTFQEEVSLNILSSLYRAKGEYKKSLDISQKILAHYRKVGLRLREARILGDMSITYERQNNYKQAINTLNEELKLRRELKDKTGEANAFYLIAMNQRKLGNPETALTNIEAAIKIIENIRSNVKNSDLRTSYFATVQSYYKFKIDLLMELHKQDPSKGYNAQALETSDRSRARGLVELLTEARANIRKGANPELLAEERRIQALIDGKEKVRFEIVNSDKIKNPIFKANAEKLQTEIEQLLSQQKQLETEIRQTSSKYANLKYPQPLTLPQIQQQLDKDTLLLQYSLGSERSFLWVVSPNSLDIYELPKKAEIDKSAINLFCLISRNSSKPPSVTNQENPCKNIKNQRIDVAAQELSQLILSPAKDKLATKRLVIVADGALQYIPFAALADVNSQPNSTPQEEKEKPKDVVCSTAGGIRVCSPAQAQSLNYQPLLVNHEIVSLPSASAIAIQRQELATRPPAPKALAILADPVYNATDTRVTNAQNKQLQKQDYLNIELEQSALKRSADILNRQGWTRLSGTRTEAQTIFNLVPKSQGVQLLDFAANYTQATSSNLNQFRILHFATHGFVNDANPELSGLVLSLVNEQGKDIRGYLRLADLFNLDYPADLIVLSACETGLGKEIQGEGLVGLTRGLMYAGAERLVVSLWQVDDKGTSEFMQEFYQQMWQHNKSPNQALRAAQLKMWQQEKWRNPNYWAAFTFLGEWR